jgi:hypothetical protein
MLYFSKVFKYLPKQTTHRIHLERFNLKKLNDVEGKEQYHVEISN